MGLSYPHDPCQAFLKRLKLLRCQIAFQKRFVISKYRPNIKILKVRVFQLKLKTVKIRDKKRRFDRSLKFLKRCCGFFDRIHRRRVDGSF